MDRVRSQDGEVVTQRRNKQLPDLAGNGRLEYLYVRISGWCAWVRGYLGCRTRRGEATHPVKGIVRVGISIGGRCCSCMAMRTLYSVVPQKNQIGPSYFVADHDKDLGATVGSSTAWSIVLNLSSLAVGFAQSERSLGVGAFLKELVCGRWPVEPTRRVTCNFWHFKSLYSHVAATRGSRDNR